MDAPGIENHYGKIRVGFTLNGRWRKQTLDWPYSPANVRKASQLRQKILRAIRNGTYDHGEWFPGSRHAESTEFGIVALRWLQSLELANSTVVGYKRLMNTHWMPLYAREPVGRITVARIKQDIAGKDWKTGKTRNNALSVLRSVFEFALDDGLIEANPAARVKMVTHQRPEADPLTLAEVGSVLDWIAANRPGHLNYFALAFFTGLRTSELIELQWSQVDIARRRLTVDRARVLGQVKPTKTNKVRTVELNSLALEALQRQQAETYLAGRNVFLDPITGKPFRNNEPPWNVWSACLKKLGMKHRAAYQTRHTFATLNVMAGANIFWVSKQLGHSSAKMTLDVYAKWIDASDSGREVAKLEAEISRKLPGNRASF